MLFTVLMAFKIEYTGTDPVLLDNKVLLYGRNGVLDIPTGFKTVKVQSIQHQYPEVTIIGQNCTLRAFAYEKPYTSITPCQLEPTKTYEYNVPKPGFSVLGFLKVIYIHLESDNAYDFC